MSILGEFVDAAKFIGLLQSIKNNNRLKRVVLQSKKVYVGSLEKSGISFETTNSLKKYIYDTCIKIKFKGRYGKDPRVYLIWSKNDEKISLDDRESVRIAKLTKNYAREYTYTIQKSDTYESNSKKILKPYIIVILGNQKISIGYIAVLDTAVAKKMPLSRGIQVKLMQHLNPFIEGIQYYDSLYKTLEPINGNKLTNDQIDNLKSVSEQIMEIVRSGDFWLFWERKNSKVWPKIINKVVKKTVNDSDVKFCKSSRNNSYVNEF